MFATGSTIKEPHLLYNHHRVCSSSDSGWMHSAGVIKTLLITVGLGGGGQGGRQVLDRPLWTPGTHRRITRVSWPERPTAAPTDRWPSHHSEHTTPLSSPCLTIIYSVLDGGSEVSAHTSLTKPPQHMHSHESLTSHTCWIESFTDFCSAERKWFIYLIIELKTALLEE